MNDLDDQLREMFDRREADLAPGMAVPPKLARRTRGRQLATVVGSIGVVIALIASVVVGLNALNTGDDVNRLGDNGPTQTIVINGITITYPQAWFAADPAAVGLDPGDADRMLPTLVLVVSTQDPAKPGAIECPARTDGSPAGVVMTIQQTQLTLVGDAAAAWPVSLQPLNGGQASDADPCLPGWTFSRSAWTEAGRSFEARVGFGPSVSDADRTALLDAYGSMSFASNGNVGAFTVGNVVLGTGSAFGTLTWTLEVDPKRGDYCLNYEAVSQGGGSCTGDAPPADAPQVNTTEATPDGAFAFGAVPGDVSTVTFEAADGATMDISLIQSPKSLGGVTYFVIPLRGSQGYGKVRFGDQQGKDLYPPQQINWSHEGGDGPGVSVEPAIESPSPG